MFFMNTNYLNSILNSFEIDTKSYDFLTVNQGFINDTYIVNDKGSSVYILQRVNTEVFVKIKEVISNIEKALKYLKDVDYQSITLVTSKKNRPFYIDEDDNVWRLMTYINKSITYDTTNNTDIAYEAGRIIGKFHKLLQQASADDFVDTISKFHDLSLRENQYQEALSKAPEKLLKKARVATEFVRSILPKIKESNIHNLAERVCHNDTKLNNILFSEVNDKALCLIDLDTLMKGYFHYDFGDAIRTIVNTASEDEQDFDKITFNTSLFEAFVDGLVSNGTFLKENEISMLPHGVILMPFLHGLRALTDYLNGNKYYKVSYEDQNLDRCYSLFNFTQKAEHKLAYMNTIIQKKMCIDKKVF